MKKTVIFLIAASGILLAQGAFAYGTGTGHHSTPDMTSTMLLCSVGVGGLVGLRKLLK